MMSVSSFHMKVHWFLIFTISEYVLITDVLNSLGDFSSYHLQIFI